jgi:hypothetical protein
VRLSGYFFGENPKLCFAYGYKRLRAVLYCSTVILRSAALLRTMATHRNCDKGSTEEPHYPSCIRCDRIMCKLSESAKAEYIEMDLDRAWDNYVEREYILKYANHIDMLKNDPVRPHKLYASQESVGDDADGALKVVWSRGRKTPIAPPNSGSAIAADDDLYGDARELPFYIVCNECRLDHTIRALTKRIETLECLLNNNK